MKLLRRRPDERSVEPAEELGPRDEVDELIEALHHDEALSRHAAAAALGRWGDPRAVEPLIEMLEFKEFTDNEGRIAAAIALGAIGDERAVAPLAEVLRRLVGIVAGTAELVADTPDDPDMPETAHGAAYGTDTARHLARALATIGGSEALDALRWLAEDEALRLAAVPAQLPSPDDEWYATLRERVAALRAVATDALGIVEPATVLAPPSSGSFRIVVVDSYFAALSAAKLHGALNADEQALGVIAAQEADGSFSFQGTDAHDVVRDLRRVEGAAVLFVPADTLPLLERDAELWSRVGGVERSGD